MFLGLAWYNWLGIVGVPSIATIIGALLLLWRKITILMKAQQAQMRKQLIDDYHTYAAQGWVSDEDLSEWENQYQGYHTLGKNGVLDKRREQLLNLPNGPIIA